MTALTALTALRIELVRSLRAGEVDRLEIDLDAGATVADALAAAGWRVDDGLAVAVWGLIVAADRLGTTALADRDRVELLRPLTVDPKEARRRRAQGQRQGQRVSGNRSR